MTKKLIVWVGLLAALLLIGCSAAVEEREPDGIPTEIGTSADTDADVSGEVVPDGAGESTSSESATITPSGEAAEPTETKVTVATVTTGAVTGEGMTSDPNPAWGEAYCPDELPLCVRPVSLEPLSDGNESALRVEVWARGEIPPGSFTGRWVAVSSQEEINGNSCTGTTKTVDFFTGYREGMGHLSVLCFRSEELPKQVRLELRPNGASEPLSATWSVGESVPPVAGWNALIGADTLEPGTSVTLGPATVTIDSIEERLDEGFVLLDVTVEATQKIGVRSPDVTIISFGGNTVSFDSLDARGILAGWHSDVTHAYDLVGGTLEAGESQQGTVVLSTPEGPWGLLIEVGTEASATLVLPDTPTEPLAAVEMPEVTAREGAIPELTALVQRQQEAAQESNADAYLSTFSDEAQETQRSNAETLAALPLTGAEWLLNPEHIGDSSVERGEVNGAEVSVSYGLEGLPEDNRFRHRLKYDFVREGEEWLIRTVEYQDVAPLWTMGGRPTEESATFVILAGDDAAQQAITLLQELERANTTLAERDLSVVEKSLVLLAPTDDSFDLLTGMGADALGGVLSYYDLSGNEVTLLQRLMVLNGEALFDPELPAEQRQAILAHEMVHLALVDTSRPFTPPWLSEGLAEHVAVAASGNVQRLVADGKLDALTLLDLTRAATLGAHDMGMIRNVGYEYLYAAATVDYLIEQYGEEAILDFYRSYGEVPANRVREQLPGGIYIASPFGDDRLADAREYFTRQLLDDAFGITVEELDVAVKAWVREQ